MTNYIEVKTLKESVVSEHFVDYEQENFERCPDCGSSLFRIYKEPVKEGLYEQMICAICNHRFGGWLNDFKVEGGVSGRICRKCGNELERIIENSDNTIQTTILELDKDKLDKDKLDKDKLDKDKLDKDKLDKIG